MWGGGRDQVSLLLHITSLFECMERGQGGKDWQGASEWSQKQHADGMNRLRTCAGLPPYCIGPAILCRHAMASAATSEAFQAACRPPTALPPPHTHTSATPYTFKPTSLLSASWAASYAAILRLMAFFCTRVRGKLKRCSVSGCVD